MKRLVLTTLIILLSFGVTAVSAARKSQTPYKIKGSAVYADSTPVQYATVVLLAPDGTQKDGTVTDAEGNYSFTLNAGTYYIEVSYMGYDSVKTQVEVKADAVLPPVTLAEAATKIETVTIKGNLITREADRFVMNNIAESPLAAGRDTYEMLSLAPGVYVKDGEIKINGRAGTKILINDREVRMTGEELMNYLKAIPAENIQKIEVIPISGAEYDASNTGGVVKITIKRLRNDGITGSVGIRGSYRWGKGYSYAPNFNFNYNRGKLNVYSNGSYYDSEYKAVLKETTDYSGGANIESSSNNNSRYNATGGMLGAVYDLDERNSVGAEYSIWKMLPTTDETVSRSTYTVGNTAVRNDSHYSELSSRLNHSLTLNYIRKIDTLGSTFKIIGDFAQNTTDGVNNYRNTASTFVNNALTAGPTDSLYRTIADADYRYYTLTADVEKKYSETTTLRFGAKYTLNDTYSRTIYQTRLADTWYDQTAYNKTTDYNENIGALYATYSTRFSNNIALTAGLRGEYTYIPQLNQKYLSIFPNANLSVPFNQAQTMMMIATYSRSINRPSFWSMNPQRSQLSEYSYQVGNPDLRPSYSNNYSLTSVLFYKYTLSVGGNHIKNNIQQVCVVDSNDASGRTLKYYTTNMKDFWQFYISMNAPVNITDWWNLNLNLTALNLNQQISDADARTRNWCSVGNFNSTVTLPHKWFIDINGYYMSGIVVGNLQLLTMGNVDISVKKRFFNDRWTATFGVDDILNVPQRIKSTGNGFNRMVIEPDQDHLSLRFSLQYNFQAGKMFKAKSVESGAKEEQSRMNGGSSSGVPSTGGTN